MKTLYVIAGIFIILMFFGLIALIAYLPLLFGNDAIDYPDLLWVAIMSFAIDRIALEPIGEWFRKLNPWKKGKE